MFLFSLLPYKFGWADVELFFKMFGEYLGGVIPQGICNFRNLHLAFCQELTCPKIALHSNNYKKCTSYD